MISEIEIYQQINSYLEDENLELYDLNLVNFPNISKVEIFIFSIQDVDIDTTTRLNKQLSRLFEDLGFEKGSFEMIVSSPGIERKLKTKRHFELAIGELIKIKLIEPVYDLSLDSKTEIYSLEGRITSINDDHILFSSEPFERIDKIKFLNIKSAKIEFKQFKEKVKG